MADGLHALLDAKRGLLLAISHELRSPLTRARLDAELVETDAARDALMRDMVDLKFAAGGVKLALDPGLPAATIDEKRIRLLLRNLLDDALHYSAGAPRPPVVTTAFDAESLKLTVRDHGPGTDKAKLPRLARLSTGPTAACQRATGRVGLGLYLCRLVAQAHGGTLRLANAHPRLQSALRLPRSGG